MNSSMCVHLVRAAFLAGLLAIPAAPAPSAEAFPSRPIRIVVPNTASTPPDIISRIIASELSQQEGWRVIVENRPGGVTTVAASDVLKQAPDGHSIFAMSVPATAAPALLPTISYGVETDFIPVIKVSVSYNVLVVNPSVPAHSMGELVALLKSRPDELTFSSGGFGTPAHLIGEMLKSETGVRATHVPYQQFPQAIGDLLNGTNQYMFITMLPVIDLIASGKLRALAVTASKRIPALADVPTTAEQGYPSLMAEDWVGFAVKAGTPDEIVTTLNLAVNRTLAKPSVKEALTKLGAEPAGGASAAYGELMRSQVALWSKVAQRVQIKLPQ
jgi:tripartite-type tricarboxylate transporter receptor subunit TctC